MNNKYTKGKGYFVLIPIGLFFGISAIVMYLWNSILPDVLGLKNISYPQALGIFALSRILFGSFHFRRNNKPPFARSGFKEKFMQLTPEEREHLKEKWKSNSCS
jgi:hypothetical protein